MTLFLMKWVSRDIFFSLGSRQEVNSTRYPEIEEPIKSREKHYSLVLYILKLCIPGYCGFVPDYTQQNSYSPGFVGSVSYITPHSQPLHHLLELHYSHYMTNKNRIDVNFIQLPEVRPLNVSLDVAGQCLMAFYSVMIAALGTSP